MEDKLPKFNLILNEDGTATAYTNFVRVDAPTPKEAVERLLKFLSAEQPTHRPV